MSEFGVYSPPSSELTKGLEFGQYGSIERGLSGQYELRVMGVISESWQRIQGNKWAVWSAVLVYLGMAIALGFMIEYLLGVMFISAEQGSEALSVGVVIGALLQNLISSAIMTPVGMGIFLIGLRIAIGLPTNIASIFDHYDKLLPFFLALIMVYLLTTIGFLLLIIPGIYLVVCYMFVLPLIVEKNMDPWEAMETSRKVVTKKWFTTCGYFLLMSILVILSAIPLGIGLIWTIPMSIIGSAVLYREMFGVSSLGSGA